MKTRQEMIYEFMVALAGNSNTHELVPSDILEDDISEHEGHDIIFIIACRLADRYLRSLG